MPNIELLEKSTPVAPVRIAALAGCQDLANEVDKKLVKFRKELVAKRNQARFHRVTAFHLFWLIPRSSVLVPVRAKVTSKNLFVVPTFYYGRYHQLQPYLQSVRTREPHVPG